MSELIETFDSHEEKKNISKKLFVKKIKRIIKKPNQETKVIISQIDNSETLTKRQKKLRMFAQYLRQAELDKVKQIHGSIRDEGGICAIGAILFYAGKDTYDLPYHEMAKLLSGTGITCSMIIDKNDMEDMSFFQIADWLESLQ